LALYYIDKRSRKTESQWFHILVAGLLGGLAVGLWKIHNLLEDIRDLLEWHAAADPLRNA
jgi:hypothetical protein